MRKILQSLAVAAVVGIPGVALAEHSDKHMQVYKSPECTCCTAWAAIAEKHGFDVTVEERPDMASVKRSAGVPDAMQSCHTARIGGYVVEGHVPMAAIERLLAARPAVTGITAPGMPAGSPGMGDDPKARFDVLAFGASDGAASSVFFRAGEE